MVSLSSQNSLNTFVVFNSLSFSFWAIISALFFFIFSLTHSHLVYRKWYQSHFFISFFFCEASYCVSMAFAPSNFVSQPFPNSVAEKLDDSNYLHWHQHVSIWNHRNKIVFQNHTFNGSRLMDEAVFVLWSWIKSMEKDFAVHLNQWSSNLKEAFNS